MPYRFLVPLALIAAPALAQDAPPPLSDVVALSPDERAAVLDRAASGKELPINGASGRGIHGDMGIEIGNHGTRAMYGTAIVPLGQNGTAAFSFLTSQSNGYRGRYR